MQDEVSKRVIDEERGEIILEQFHEDTISGPGETIESVALDISSISHMPFEEEVLILPYTSFELVNITHLPTGRIELKLMFYGF
jgi:hypothetical protein